MEVQQLLFIAVIVMISLVFIRHRTRNGVFGLFAGFVAIFISIQFASINVTMLVLMFALLGLYLIYEGLMKV